MRKHSILLAAMLLIFNINSVYAQCTFQNKQENGNTYYPRIGSQTVGVGNSAYGRFNVINGGTYTFTTCGNAYDNQLTGWNSSNTGSYIFYNDDSYSTSTCLGCTTGQCNSAAAGLTWTSNFSGTVYVQNTVYSCHDWITDGNKGSTVLTYSCAAPTDLAVGTAGNGTWNIFCYDAGDANGNSGAWSTNYAGYYTDNTLNFNTQNRWASGGSPSDANATGGNAYKGCYIYSDNHSWRAIRTNIAQGVYQLQVTHDDIGQILINGTTVYNNATCCNSYSAGTYAIVPGDVIEYRVSEGTGGSNGLITFNTGASLSAGSIGYSGYTNVCTGYDPPAFTSSADASGGALASINGYGTSAGGGTTTYQWLLNGSPIASANSSTYDPTALNTPGTYIYSRKVTDRFGNTATTGTYTITVTDPGTNQTTGNNYWYVSCYNSASDNTNYVGYYTETSLSFNTTNRFGTSSYPSAANSTGSYNAGVGYTGCAFTTSSNIYSLSARRQGGWTCGMYAVTANWDDNYQFYVNGQQLASGTCCGSSSTTIWTGYLDNSSTVIFNLQNTGGGGNASLTFTPITTTSVTLTPTVTNNPVCPSVNNATYSVALSGGLSNVKKMRVVQNKADNLNLAEIRAFEVLTGTNVALASNGGTANESSNYSNSYPASNLIDGNTGNFAHTNANIGEYMEIVFNAPKNLDYIQIVNRGDCCQSRADNLSLEFYDNSGTLMYRKAINAYQNQNTGYTYTENVLDVSWNDGATTLSRTGLSAATYTLSYSDVLCKTGTNSTTITNKTNVSIGGISSSAGSPICASATTNLTANSVAGTGATVTWWTGSGGTGTNLGTGTTLNNRGPGTYYARVTGDCGTPAEASIVIGSKTDVSIGSISSSAGTAICSGSTTNLTANSVAGTNATVTWWTGSGGTGTNLGTGTTLNNRGAGTYYARVTGDCGTPAEASIIITNKTDVSIGSVSSSAGTAICSGSTTNLTANSVAGTNATVTWWTGTGGTGTNLGTGTTLNNRGAGTYYARVTGDCGTPAEASIIITNKTDVSIGSISSSAGTAICSGSTTNLTANSVAGTNATVTWWTGSGGTGSNLGTGTTLNNRGAGTYYARVTGDCGTPAEASIVITNKTNVGITNVTSSAVGNAVCPSATTNLTANGVVGTNATVTWWTGTGGTGSNLGTGTTLSNRGAGTYYARVTGDCGTPAEASITITTNTNVSIGSISSSAGTAICNGSTTNLTANSVAGTNATVTWWTGSGGTGSNLGTGTTLNNRGAGTYYARVTGDCGTPAEASIVITYKTDVGITNVTSSAGTDICNGSTTNLTANGVVGTNATVTWWTGSGGTGSNLGTGTTLNNRGAGTYYARVTGDCGTAVQASITINNKTDVSIGSISSSNGTTVCTGGTVNLTANSVAGTNATVTWWTGTGGTGSNLGTGTTLNNRGAGTYYARVTGDCGTPAEASITISSVSQPSVSISGNGSSCVGAVFNLSANTSGGTGTLSYQWQSSSDNVTYGNVGPNSANYSPTVNSTTYYKVTYSASGAGCAAATSAAALVTINPGPFATTTWTGATDNDWFKPSNWTNCVPGSVTDVTIPSGLTNYPSVYSANPSVNSLTINSGASMTLNGGYTLTSNTNVTVQGTFTMAASSTLSLLGNLNVTGTFNGGNGTVTFTGSGTSTVTSGSGTFYNLTVNKSGGAKVTLANNITGAGTVTVTNGTFEVPTNKTAQFNKVSNSNVGTINVQAGALLKAQ